MRHAGGEQPYMLQGSLSSKPSKVQEVHTGGEGEGGRYGAKNSPSKVAKHFSLLLDGKLPRIANMVISFFWLRDRITKSKLVKLKNTGFWPKSPNFILVFKHYY